jgi:hypothetical protein
MNGGPDDLAFGRWALVEQLSRGEPMEDWLAFSREPFRPDEPVFLRRLYELDAPVEARAAVQRRAEAELAILRALSAPGLPEVIDSGRSERRLWWACEWVPGVTLGELLQRANAQGGRIDARVALAIGRDLAGILARAHAAAREVGPALPGASGWGLDDVRLRWDGALYFTAAHRWALPRLRGLPGPGAEPDGAPPDRWLPAPEQLRGEPGSESTDVFFIGRSVFALLAGQDPFTADTWQDAVRRTVHAERPLLAQVRPGLDGDLDGLFRVLLDPDPRMRGTPEEAAKRFNAALSVVGDAPREAIAGFSRALLQERFAADEERLHALSTLEESRWREAMP